jgi:hypothetical protein
MLVVVRPPGRLCNRLWLFAQLAAAALEYGYPLVFDLGDYARFFEATRADDFAGHPISARLRRSGAASALLRGLLRAGSLPPVSRLSGVHRLRSRDGVDLASAAFVASARTRTLLLDVELFHQLRDEPSLARHADAIRGFLRPVAPHRRRVAELVAELRGDDALLVGVHRRRGDYARWRGGLYCFADSVYRDKMTQCRDLLAPAGREVRFVVASNEPVDPGAFRGLAVRPAPGHPVEDLYLLAACDYLIGPPSSYSAWASFHGRVPLCVLSRCDAKLEASGFRVARSILRLLEELPR